MPLPDPSSSVQAVLRACSILRAFRYNSELLRLRDLVERTGLSKTTVYRLLQTLEQGGLVERADRYAYRVLLSPHRKAELRIGYAAQTTAGTFARLVNDSLMRASMEAGVDLVMVDNRHSASVALRNAERLVKAKVDVAIEFQTHERVAAIVSSRLVQAGIPVIALEVPHPGAVYFGANNYQAGQMGGRAIARWARKHWESEAEEIVLLKESQSGPLPKLRLTGMLHGLREELPALERTPVTELDGKGLFAPAHDVIRRHVRRAPNRRTLVLAHNDLMALGAIRGFEEAGRGGQCGVVGQNAIPEAREELRRPGTPLIGTVAYFPEQYGDRVIPLALALAAGKNPPAAQYTKHVLLTPGNVNEVYPVDLELPAGYQDHSVNPLSG